MFITMRIQQHFVASHDALHKTRFDIFDNNSNIMQHNSI